MKNTKGFTLVELVIVVAIISILTAVAVPSFINLKQEAEEKVDLSNAQIITSAITCAIIEGTLEIRSNKIYNTSTNKRYANTGGNFFKDMGDYIESRVEPASSEARNEYNDYSKGKYFRYSLAVKNGNLTIFYKNSSNKRVNIYTAKIQ